MRWTNELTQTDVWSPPPCNFSDCIQEDCSVAHTTSSPLSSAAPTSPPPSSSSRPRSLPPPQSFLDRLTRVGSPNGGDRKHRDASAVLPFIGLTDSEFTPTLRMYRPWRWGATGGGGFQPISQRIYQFASRSETQLFVLRFFFVAVFKVGLNKIHSWASPPGKQLWDRNS